MSSSKRESSLIDKALLLKRTPLFAGLDLEMLLPIADKMGSLRLQRGHLLFSVGEEATRLYLVQEGEVILSDVGGAELARVQAGEFFGDEALLSGTPRAYSASCAENSTLLALSQSNLLTILSECPSVAICLLEGYARVMPLRIGRE